MDARATQRYNVASSKHEPAPHEVTVSSARARRASAFAPASVGNAAVGFDILGFCLGVVGDVVTVERTDDPSVKIRNVSGMLTDLPKDPASNTATAGLLAMREDLGLSFGFSISIEKGIELGSGMGGSAASAVGSVVAANALLDEPLTQSQMLTYALIGEAAASRAYHADNVAPCLMGGLVLARVSESIGAGSSRPTVEATAIPIPGGIWCALAKPKVVLETKASRAALSPNLSLKDHVRQTGRLAAFVAGCYQNNLELVRNSLEDVLVEPQRASLIPGFARAKAAALAVRGALGCSIAGAGPSVFAWCASEASAREVERAMAEAFRSEGFDASSFAAALPAAGARLLP